MAVNTPIPSPEPLIPTVDSWLADVATRFADNRFSTTTEADFRAVFSGLAQVFADWRHLSVKRVKGATYPVPYTDNLGLVPADYRILGMQAEALNGVDSVTGAAGVRALPVYFTLLRDSSGSVDALLDAEPGTVLTVKARWVRVSGTDAEKMASFPVLVLEDHNYVAGDVVQYTFSSGETRLFEWKRDATEFQHPVPTGLDTDPNYTAFAPLSSPSVSQAYVDTANAAQDVRISAALAAKLNKASNLADLSNIPAAQTNLQLADFVTDALAPYAIFQFYGEILNPPSAITGPFDGFRPISGGTYLFSNGGTTRLMLPQNFTLGGAAVTLRLAENATQPLLVYLTTGYGKSITIAPGDIVAFTALPANDISSNPTAASVGFRVLYRGTIAAPTASSSGVTAAQLEAVRATIAYSTYTTHTTVNSNDLGNIIRCANAGPMTLTIPLDADMPCPVGTHIEFAARTAQVVTLVGAAGVTLQPVGENKVPGQWRSVGAIKDAANVWVLTGASV